MSELSHGLEAAIAAHGQMAKTGPFVTPTKSTDFCTVVAVDGFPCPNSSKTDDEIDVTITTVVQLIAGGSTEAG